MQPFSCAPYYEFQTPYLFSFHQLSDLQSMSFKTVLWPIFLSAYRFHANLRQHFLAIVIPSKIIIILQALNT